MNLFFLTHLFCCFALTGLIWTIQLVHYPSFFYVSDSKFVEFENFHGRRISYIVIPLMVLELLTAFALLFDFVKLNFLENSFVVFNLSLVVLIWLSTFLLSVPCHQKLSKKKSEETIRALVLTNWPRTFFWSLRSLFFVYLLTHLVS